MSMSQLSKLSDEQAEVKAQLKKKAQESVRPALREAFEELTAVIPGLTAVRWQQYTPHFNDGEPCEFGLHGLYINLGAADGGDYDDGFEDAEWGEPAGITSAGKTLLKSFCKSLGDIETLLQMAFDDHAQVTLNRESIEVEEYEHD